MKNKDRKIYCFLILHYLTIEDTQKCVESIITNFSSDDCQIIIVDNGSKNGTGKKLKNMYQKKKMIDVLLNEKNLGFSRGNNVGFKYAKEKYNPKFIIMLNNDTYITQKDFLNRISLCYNQYKFAVLGPKIILKNNKIFKMNEKMRTVEEINRNIKDIKLRMFLNKIYVYNMIKKFKLLFQNKLKNEFNDSLDIKEDVVLHGCCLIFSEIYINKFDGLEEKTFLYGEEELLFLRIVHNNMKIMYNPEIEIHHNEDGSTSAMTISNRQKNDFIFKNQLLANQVILDSLLEVERNDLYEEKIN